MLEYIKRGGINEAVIQSEFYLACKEVGLDIDLQYSIGLGCLNRDMPDAVVIENFQIIAIVEVKNYKSFNCLGSVSENQISRYKKRGVPVFVLCSKYDIPYLVKKLLVVRDRFLEKADPEKSKYFIADKKSEKLKQFELDLVFNAFNQTFPDYEYTEKHSLELLVEAVKKLGIREVLYKFCRRDVTVDSFMEDLRTHILWTKRNRTAYGSLFQTSGFSVEGTQRMLEENITNFPNNC